MILNIFQKHVKITLMKSSSFRNLNKPSSFPDPKRSEDQIHGILSYYLIK